jgi:hypothetical protein
MKTLGDIEGRLRDMRRDQRQNPLAVVDELLGLGEQIMEHWLQGKGEVPTGETREGFRLLALHRQGCIGDPSFNACRESCRELLYYYNLVQAAPAHSEVKGRIAMARAVALHLCLFVGGKMQDPELGDFCCSSKPLRSNKEAAATVTA